jgi:hypothetical protein
MVHIIHIKFLADPGMGEEGKYMSVDINTGSLPFPQQANTNVDATDTMTERRCEPL